MSTTTIIEPTALAYGFAQTQAIHTALARQAATWTRLQSDLLEIMSRGVNGWIQRRREGITAASQMLERASAADDLPGILVVYSDWLHGSLLRLSEDAAALTNQSLALLEAAGHSLKASPQTGIETLRPVRPDPAARAAE